MRYQINLLPNREGNFTDKIIYFSFHYLRYILVITQLVVISVFFYRFQIDQQVVDLKDSIKQKSEIILVSSSLLKDIRAIDIKMQSITRAANDQQAMLNMYQYFLNTFPSELFVSTFDMTSTGITFTGYTSNANMIRIYNNRLLKDKRFELIKLSNINKDDVNYTFSFELKNYIGK